MTNAVAIAQGGSNNVTQRNRIINGAMVIDQRNAGASTTPNNTGAQVYCLDRWATYGNPGAKFSVQQNAGSVTPPAGFTNYLGITSLSAYSSAASDQMFLQQYIEGYNTADLNWGSANAKPITISFWVYSSLTGTFGGALENSNGSRSYAFTYTVSSANTWTQASVTIAGDTSGTWQTTTSTGIQCYWNLGCGTTYSKTAGSWGSNNVQNATGSVSIVGTNGATFYITGVQLEAGTTASPFEYRQYGTELALCLRYYWQAATGTSKELTVGWYYSTTQISLVMNMPVPMRTGPTLSQVTGTDYYTIFSNNTSDPFNSLTIENAGTTMVSLLNSTQVSGTAGYSGLVRTTNASSYIGFTAEL